MGTAPSSPNLAHAMLVELAVRDLGVIADLRLAFGPAMSVLTGETGAGKTMIVEAISLLLGGKTDPSRVRPGATESVVEGLFVDADDHDVVLRRVVPAVGRSRCYVNGELATAANLADVGGALVEICGQHSHQRLQSTRAQREALDRFGKIDLAPLSAARARRGELGRQMDALGGDERARAREIDLLRYQLAELDEAAIVDPDEDRRLSEAEDVLSDAVAHLEAAVRAGSDLSAEGGALELVGSALALLAKRAPYLSVAQRLDGVAAELGDVATELRAIADGIDEDPERLDALRRRRQLLVELRRKYGDSLSEVIAFHREVGERLADLESHEERARLLESEIATVAAEEARAAAEVGRARRLEAPHLGGAVCEHLGALGLGSARIVIEVGDTDPGDDVAFLLSANSGMDPQPLAKSASGGELSRTMLALHLVLSEGAPTMIFDEVDAGIGGAAAVSVGRALSRLSTTRQVLVVTHLPQVAAFADIQLLVAKSDDGIAVSTIVQLDDSQRVIELSRMLSGSPDSETAQEHAAEMLADAASERGR